MNDEKTKQFLMAAIFATLVVILATPFIIGKQPAAFTQTPILKMGYLSNRTVYDVHSLDDHEYAEMKATVTEVAGQKITRHAMWANDSYAIYGETQLLRFNLTITVIDKSQNEYWYMGDVNITKLTYRGIPYMFFNVTEHGNDWSSRDVSVAKQDLPYRVSLNELRREGQ